MHEVCLLRANCQMSRVAKSPDGRVAQKHRNILPRLEAPEPQSFPRRFSNVASRLTALRCSYRDVSAFWGWHRIVEQQSYDDALIVEPRMIRPGDPSSCSLL
uniref:(northern house mosquito) hypothetical protein n=1 Tax=Culex pipiens TaxID=7175 RepID=A0A8D8JK00_CULPI